MQPPLYPPFILWDIYRVCVSGYRMQPPLYPPFILWDIYRVCVSGYRTQPPLYPPVILWDIYRVCACCYFPPHVSSFLDTPGHASARLFSARVFPIRTGATVVTVMPAAGVVCRVPCGGRDVGISGALLIYIYSPHTCPVQVVSLPRRV
ncbi:hypothetical protein FKM82_030688 [Ascaphus truei]